MTRGEVAAGHPSVAQAAAEMLRAGGNAFDAVVAAGFAGAVAEPALTSLGGGGFLLARPATCGRALVLDFFVDTPGRELPPRELEPHFLPVTVHFPASDQLFNTGLASAAVPGVLLGLLEAHERLGSVPLDEVLSPAIELARGGLPVNPHQAYFLGLLEPIVTLTEAGRALFAPAGRVLREGERLRNPDLADFLECLPSDRGRELYTGATARRIARDMHEGGGLLTEADLAAYAVVERRPLEVAYRGHRLLTNPPPSFGGSLLGLSLVLQDAVLGAEAPAPAGSPADLLALAGVMEEVDRLRAAGCLGPAALSAGERRRACGRVRRLAQSAPPRFARGTTHVSVWDAAGNAASLSTSNGEGSGYVVPGAGIMLNNMLGEDDLHPDGFHASPPGRRVASMMSPSVLLRDGAVRLVLGSGGSKRIRTALLQVIHQVVDFEAGARRAVEHPRLHWDGEQLQVEPGLPPESLEALARHRPVNVWDRRDVYFGGVHAVSPGAGSGGAGDPRRGGAAETV